MRPRRPMSSASSSRLTPALTLRTLAALGTSLLKGMSRAPFNTSFGVDVAIGSNLRDGWGRLSPHIVPSERPTPVSSSSTASHVPTLKWKGRCDHPACDTISGWLGRDVWLGPPVEVCAGFELIAVENAKALGDDLLKIGEGLEVLVGQWLVEKRGRRSRASLSPSKPVATAFGLHAGCGRATSKPM